MFFRTDILKKTVPVQGAPGLINMCKLYVTFKLSFSYFQLGRQKAAKEVEKEAQKLEQELYATKGVRIE